MEISEHVEMLKKYILYLVLFQVKGVIGYIMSGKLIQKDIYTSSNDFPFITLQHCEIRLKSVSSLW